MELEVINKLYLELSQVATAKTAKEVDLEKRLEERKLLGKLVQDIFNAGYQAALASQAQQEPAKAKHHPICDRRYPSLCDACNAEAKEESQARQESKQGCKECDGQTYIHSPTGEYLGECPFCTKEEEPYAYDVPTKDGTELAYAIYFNKYNNPLPEGAIPLYASQQDHIPDAGKMVRNLRVQIGGGPDWGDDPVGKCTARCFDFPNCKCTGLEP